MPENDIYIPIDTVKNIIMKHTRKFTPIKRCRVGTMILSLPTIETNTEIVIATINDNIGIETPSATAFNNLYFMIVV